MAAIGDVLVKFVADFAEFSTNMDKSQKQIESWMQSISKAGQSIDGFISLAKRISGALALAEAVNQVKQYADNIQKAAVTTADLARSTGLTSAQVQALQALAEKTGDSFSELAKKGAQNHEWLDQVTADAQRLGQVMDDSVIRTLKDLQVQSDEASRRLQVLFAPAVAGAKSWLADQLERIANDLATIGLQQGVLDKLFALAQMLGYGGGAGASQQFRIDALTDQVARREAELAAAQKGPTPREIGMGVPGADVGAAQKALDDARALLGQAKDAAAKAAYGTTTVDAKAITVVAYKPTGGGGKTDDDSIEAQIKRYNALAKSAESAFATIKKSAQEPIEILQRNVAVQQQIDDIAGKLGAKYDQASAANKQRLRDAITAAETERSLVQQRLQDNVKAAALEEKLGDGTQAMQHALRDLNREYATGRVSVDAYNRALKQQQEAIQQSALEAKRYDDNLGSLGAGFEHAANAYARANDLYSTGEQVFNGLTSSMMEGLKALEGQSNKSFGQIAADFANMLANLALQAAASAAFKAIFGAIGAAAGGAAGGVTAAAVPAGGFSAGIGANGLGWLTPRAGGGPVNAGGAYVVGERGPEFFVPSAAGNIVPMNSSNSGGGSVTVNVDMNRTEGAADPSQALEFGRKVKAAVQSVILNEKRPGGSLYSRVTA